MQNIQLPDDQYEKLSVAAQAAGFADVTAFVRALIAEPIEDPRGPLSEAELAASLNQCDRSMAEFDAGGGRDAEEAFVEMARKRGIDLD